MELWKLTSVLYFLWNNVISLVFLPILPRWLHVMEKYCKSTSIIADVKYRELKIIRTASNEVNDTKGVNLLGVNILMSQSQLKGTHIGHAWEIPLPVFLTGIAVIAKDVGSRVRDTCCHLWCGGVGGMIEPLCVADCGGVGVNVGP